MLGVAVPWIATWLPFAVPSTAAIVKPSFIASVITPSMSVPVATDMMCVRPPRPLPARTACDVVKAILILLKYGFALCAYFYLAFSSIILRYNQQLHSLHQHLRL